MREYEIGEEIENLLGKEIKTEYIFINRSIVLSLVS